MPPWYCTSNPCNYAAAVFEFMRRKTCKVLPGCTDAGFSGVPLCIISGDHAATKCYVLSYHATVIVELDRTLTIRNRLGKYIRINNIYGYKRLFKEAV